MQKYQNNVISPTGLALANVSVLVQNYPIGTTATIFSDNGTTVAPNPLTTDANGAFAFYADDGHYSLVISGPSVQTLTLTDIVLADEIPGDNIAATTVHLTDIITVQQGTDLRAATIDQVRSAILSGGAALAVTQGGTGLETLTSHELLIGNGTNPVNQVALGTTGQVLTSNGANADPSFQAIPVGSGTLIGIRTITSTGAYTPTPGTTSVIVDLLSGGGAGGGVVATGAGTSGVSSGGQAGGRAVSRLTSGFSGVTVTIGSGGNGSPGAAGGFGGASGFGGLINVPGGAGGNSGAATAAPTVTVVASSVAAPTGGNISNTPGMTGSIGVQVAAGINVSGNGGSSPFGRGGVGTSITAGGNIASGFAAGGGGGAAAGGGGPAGGGPGTAGVCFIYEYT